MAIEIFDHEQGSAAWFRVRMGMPTASNFSTVLAKGKGGVESKTRQKYLYQLAGELVCGEPMESFTNGYLDRGKVMEAEARDCYELMHDVDVQCVGFIKNGDRGCSPDGLIGTDGAIEIKTQAPHLLIATIFAGDVPPEHVAQLQGNLWVAEREWIDLCIFYHGMPMFERRVVRDEPYIKMLDAAVREFNAELADVVAKIRAMS